MAFRTRSASLGWASLLVGSVCVALLAMVAIHRRAPSADDIGDRAMSKLRHTVAVALAWTAGSIHAQSLAPLPAPPPTTIGINLGPFNVNATTAPFANLAIGSDWFIDEWKPLTDQQQDKDGNVLSVPAGSELRRFIMVPPTGPEGFDARCTFTGAGSVTVAGNATPAKPGPQRSVTLHLLNVGGRQPKPWLSFRGFDAADPVRNVDCRDTRIARDVRFRPEAMRPVRGFGTVRFVVWQNANANVPVTWRTRRLPGALRIDRDGIAIEDMLAYANALGADPWFVVPWNSDDDYVTRFAQLVRAQLPPGRSVYVETGNEVWNTAFPVSQQAIKEGLARGLSADPGQAGMRRYAQRTVEVMRLWDAAFAGRRGLVRVLATQHAVPSIADATLAYGDTARHVDALATAPYFGGVLLGKGNTRDAGLAMMEGMIPATLELVSANRRVAAAHGKRYLGYEGGPSLAIPVQNDLLEQIQHDEALYGLTQRFLAGWAARGGDVLCLYNSVDVPTSWGMWGLAETESDTLEQAPKLRAARDFSAGHPNRPVAVATPIAPGPGAR